MDLHSFRRVAVIPAGGQVWFKHTTAAAVTVTVSGTLNGPPGSSSSSSSNLIAFCSTLATYIHDADNFELKYVLSAHRRPITCVSWCRQDRNSMVTSGTDNRVYVWDIVRSDVKYSLMTASEPSLVAWSPHDIEVITIVCEGSVHVWRYASCATMHRIGSIVRGKIVAMQWSQSNATVGALLAVGSSEGRIYLWDCKQDKVIKGPSRPHGKDTSVLDIQWDPHAGQFILVTQKQGYGYLLDATTNEVLMEFTKQPHSAELAQFMPRMPGTFVTMNRQSSLISIWNVSQADPLDQLKLTHRTFGINSAVVVPGTSTLAVSLMNGSKLVYDLHTHRQLFLTPPSHSETIFDCRFKPSNANLVATGSFDSTTKIWDADNMSILRDLVGQGGIIYGVSWCPGGPRETRLATGSSNGTVCVWDVSSGAMLRRINVHSDKIMRITWNQWDKRLIAATSQNGELAVFEDSGHQFMRIKHSCPVFGVDWNPHNKTQLCIGTGDGQVLVYDTKLADRKPIHVLCGHDGRVFNAIWSPLLPGIIASGSDDTSVRIWCLPDSVLAGGDNTSESTEMAVLLGHTNRVRALSWHTESPRLLFSGSWDCSIRMWDVKTGECLQVIDEHRADVYGITMHPLRPFLLATTSRDATTHYWSLSDLAMPMIRRAILNDGLLAKDTWAPATEAYEIGIDTRATWSHAIESVALPCELTTLSGAELQSLMEEAEDLNLVERLGTLLDFFYGQQNISNLWKMVVRIATHAPADYTKLTPCGKDPMLSATIATHPEGIIHRDDIFDEYSSILHELEQSIANDVGVGHGRFEDRVMATADLHMRLGNVRAYCEKMIEIDEWSCALAVAAGADARASVDAGNSATYWSELTTRYATHQTRQMQVHGFAGRARKTATVSPLHLLLASKNYSEAVDLLIAESDWSGAFLIATSIESDDSKHQPNELIDRVNSARITELMKCQRYIEAATCHLSVSNAEAAVDTLCRADKLELAAAVSKALGVHSDSAKDCIASLKRSITTQ
jgi:WD repeat-containing protein 17